MLHTRRLVADEARHGQDYRRGEEMGFWIGSKPDPAMKRLGSWRWREEPIYWVGWIAERGMVSACRLFHRQLVRSDASIEIEVVGIGGVFTAEDRRGKGFATMMLHGVQSHFEGEVAGLVLHGRRSDKHNLYAEMGFQKLWDDCKKGSATWFFPTTPVLTIHSLLATEWALKPGAWF